MSRLLLLVFVVCLISLPADAQPATLTGVWRPDGYTVTWSAGEAACVFVLHGGLTRRVPIDCAPAGSVLLIQGGDDGIAARAGALVELRAAWGLALLAEETIPDTPPIARLALPIVAVPVARSVLSLPPYPPPDLPPRPIP